MITTLLALSMVRAAEPTAQADEPYRILLWLQIAPGPRFPDAYRRGVESELRLGIARLFGRAWEIETGEPPAGVRPDALPASDVMSKLAAKKDKVLWIRVEPDSEDDRFDAGGARLWAREFDVEFAEWGPAVEELAHSGPRLATEILAAATRAFRPLAIVSAVETSSRARAIVRGLALMPGGKPEPLVEVGAAFRVVRDYFSKDQREQRVPIAWTYLVFRDTAENGAIAWFDVLSGVNNPLSGRTRRKTRLVAIGVGWLADATTTVRFVTGPENRPAVGFSVSVRPQDQTTTVVVGNTDHRGEAVIRPIRLFSEAVANADSPRVLNVTLHAGRSLMAAFPVVPGDRPALTVRVPIDAILTDASGKVTALQEDVVDVVARRTILLKRLEKAAAKNDMPAAKKIADEINALPGKKDFADRLAAIKKVAETKTKEANRPKLGVAVNRLFLQTENLLSEFFRQDRVNIGVTEQPDAGAPPSPPTEKERTKTAESK